MFLELNTAQFAQQFAAITAVIDPIGTIPVYLAVTASVAVERRRGVAIRAVLIAALVLIGFLVVGQPVLDAIGIHLLSFQIAGGIVLFLFALTMIFGESKPETELAQMDVSDGERAVFPLAIPSIASPGAMLAVVIMTDNDLHTIGEQVVTAGIVLVVLAITLLLLLAAMPIQRMIGNAGASIISRVMGLLLAAIAVDNVIAAIAERFGI